MSQSHSLKVMKKVILSVMASLFTLGVNAGNVMEPEYNGQVAIVNADSTTTLLATEESEIKAKSNHLGYVPVAGMFLGKGLSYVVVKGKEASTKVTSKDVTLIVRVKNHDDNPVSTVGIVKYESKKKERRWLMSESGLLSGTSVKTIVGNVKFEAKKYGESSYLITVKGLESGEYGVYVSAVESASTFSVK